MRATEGGLYSFLSSQIMDLLVELNNCPQLSPEFRFDLNLPNASNGAPRPVEDLSGTTYDAATAKRALKEAQSELRAKEITPIEYKRLQESILHSKPFAPSKSYRDLSAKFPQISGRSYNWEPSFDQSDSSVGFILPRDEDQYIQDLDAFIAGDSMEKRPNSYANIMKSEERSIERDRDAALRNPVSVYNWLRKNQPGVFLQDKEIEIAAQQAANGSGPNEGGGKSSSRVTGTSRASKRGSIQVTTVKQDPEMYDEDGIALDLRPVSSSRAKRKRDDDGAYRSKTGGSSGRSAKRKREEGSGGSRRGSRKIGTPG